jgi:hypothetical protein
MSNSAAWIVGLNIPVKVDPAEDWKPGKDEMVIEVRSTVPSSKIATPH